MTEISEAWRSNTKYCPQVKTKGRGDREKERRFILPLTRQCEPKRGEPNQRDVASTEMSDQEKLWKRGVAIPNEVNETGDPPQPPPKSHY